MQKIESKPVYATYSGEVPFVKGQILWLSQTEKEVILKIYHRTWWRKLLTKVGFDMKLSDTGIVVKTLFIQD